MSADPPPSAGRDRRIAVLQYNLRALAAAAGAAAERAAALESELERQRARAAQLESALSAARAPGGDRPAAAARQPAGAAGKGRVAVVSWDLAHNPAGRAIVLYDLLAAGGWHAELVGPLWARYGGKLWSPIAGGKRSVRAFPCEGFTDFWVSATALAATARYDLVVIVKPRLPAILLGALIARSANCPFLLDIDDLELAFADSEVPATLDELEADAPAALAEPYGSLATRACDSVIRDVPSVVVSNAALRARFGGVVVRHARNEELFDPRRFDRGRIRGSLGITLEDFALIFVGTPRPHKGVLDVARALDRMPDKRFVLHIFGDVTDRRDLRDLDRLTNARVVRHPGCGFDELPRIIAAADAVVLLQDPRHPISRFQIPAKISDAAAFGLPVIMTDVPPVRDLAELGVLRTIEPEALPATLEALMAERAVHPSGFRPAVRAAFETELGFAVNGARMELAVARARQAGPGLPASFERLLAIAEGAYAALRRSERAMHTVPAAAAPVDSGHDFVMFWKQNDSGVYGRRPDMLMKHFLESGRVRRVLQFDAPLEMSDLARLGAASDGPASAQFQSLRNAMDDQRLLRDSDRHRFRTFLWTRGRSPHPLFAEARPSLADYPAYVAAQMAAAGIDPGRAIAWVCPVVFDFLAIARAIGFRARIGDLIDDQRAFDMTEAYRRRIEESYLQTLPLLDLVFTNCEPVRDAFASLARDIRVVPNGTELIDHDALTEAPELVGVKRPIIGYVGNLRDRIDWPLLHEVAVRIPHASLVIVGGGARPECVAELRKLANVTFVGVVPYHRVLPVIAGFDVAIVPHLRSPLTDRMNPLKIYNYFASRRPIVTTPVANIDAELLPFLRVAEGAADFVRGIEESLGARPDLRPGYDAALAGITWNRRATMILDAIDAWLAEHGR